MNPGRGAQAERPLMLGMGWFPADTGGLARYFGGLYGALADEGLAPRAVVVGPVEHAPAGVVVASRASAPMPLRLLALTRAARRSARDGAMTIDAHFALYASLPLALPPLRRRPLVVHFHGPWSDESLATGQSSPAVTIKKSIERRLYRRADRVVVLSSAFRRLLIERYGVSPWRIDVIPPGLDLEHFSPGDGADRPRLGLAADAWVAVAARRLVPRMGLDVMLRAWSEIAAPGDVLAVIGDGPHHAALQTLADELGVGGRVRFLGRVDDAVLRTWYRAADVSIVPSLELEGFGLVVLEALACGTPVVVSDVGGLPEAVAGLGGSCVVPAGDVRALARRLEEARAGTPPLPSRRACREHAEGFTWKRAAHRHRLVYAAAGAPARPRTRPRVVYLDHTAALSGGELALLRLLRALEGVDAHVILAEDGPLVRRLADAGISCEVMPMAETARSLGRERVSPGGLPVAASLRAGSYTARLARRLRALRPDLVHTNSLKAAVYGTAAARVAGVPVIWHLHDRLSADYLPGPAVRLMRGIARTLPQAIIANSETSRATLPRVRCRVEVIPCPVEPVDAAGSRAQEHPLRVGVVGRIAPWKGQRLFLEGFASAFPGGDERAVLIGAPLFGEDDYEETLHADVGRLGLGERVEFRGFRDDVPGELRRLDVLVHSSVIPEPFGQTVLEGMAAGLPVIVPDQGGPAEIVDDTRTGLLYRIGDAEAMARALRRLNDDPDLRARLGGDARVAAAEYAPQLIAARVERLYADVLATRRSGSAE